MTAAGDAATDEKGKEEKAYWGQFVEKVTSDWAPSLEKEPPAVKLKLQPITMVMYAAALVPDGKGPFPLRRLCGAETVMLI